MENEKYGRLTNYVLSFVGTEDKIKDFRFWMPMEIYAPVGFGLVVNTNKFKLMECRFATREEVDSDSHALGREYDYKARIVPVNEEYSHSARTTYADDIFADFEKGIAVVKEDGDYLVEDVKTARDIGGGFIEYFCGDILYNKDNNIKWTDCVHDEE